MAMLDLDIYDGARENISSVPRWVETSWHTLQALTIRFKTDTIPINMVDWLDAIRTHCRHLQHIDVDLEFEYVYDDGGANDRLRQTCLGYLNTILSMPNLISAGLVADFPDMTTIEVPTCAALQCLSLGMC